MVKFPYTDDPVEGEITMAYEDLDRDVLENMALGRGDRDQQGQAKAELVRRDRAFQVNIENTRGENEVLRKRFDERIAQENRQAAEALAERQMKSAEEAAEAARHHAEWLFNEQTRVQRELAKEQAETARELAAMQIQAQRELTDQQVRVARASARAAIAAAFAAFLSVIVTGIQAFPVVQQAYLYWTGHGQPQQSASPAPQQ